MRGIALTGACRPGTRLVGSVCLAAWGATAGVADAKAQDNTGAECSGLCDADAEIACLRAALARSEKALAEAVEPVSSVPEEAGRTLRTVPPDLATEQAPRMHDRMSTRQGSAETFGATITAFREDREGLLLMKLDNGQIWRQREHLRVRLRLEPNETNRVEISRSGFGGYRMRFPMLNREIVVSRIE